jgi:hypothetical protein
MDTSTRKLRVTPVRPIRDTAFYDRMVRERSPYTGVLECPRISSVYSLAPESRWPAGRSGVFSSKAHRPIRRVHLLALGLIVLGSLVALVSLKGHGMAMASAVVPAETHVTLSTPARKPADAGRMEDAPDLVVNPGAKRLADPSRDLVDIHGAVVPKTDSETAAVSSDETVRPSYAEMIQRASSGSFKKRHAALREAIEAYPDEDEALARLSVRLMERARYRDMALELANRAAELNRENAMAWLAIGYIHQMTGNDRAARQAYVKCAKGEGPKKFVRDCQSLI